MAKSSRRGMGAGVVQGGFISPVLFSLYVNDMPPPSHHVKLALYTEKTAIIAVSCMPTLLVSYLESYPNDVQQWLSEWRMAINISKSTVIIFAKAGWCFTQPGPVTIFREPLKWVDTTRYLSVTLDTQLNCSPHIDQVGKNSAQRMGVLGPLLNWRCDLSNRNGVLPYKQIICRCYNPSVFTLLWVSPGTLVAGRFKRIWVFHYSPTTSEPELRALTLVN